MDQARELIEKALSYHQSICLLACRSSDWYLGIMPGASSLESKELAVFVVSKVSEPLMRVLLKRLSMMYSFDMSLLGDASPPCVVQVRVGARRLEAAAKGKEEQDHSAAVELASELIKILNPPASDEPRKTPINHWLVL